MLVVSFLNFITRDLRSNSFQGFVVSFFLPISTSRTLKYFLKDVPCFFVDLEATMIPNVLSSIPY